MADNNDTVVEAEDKKPDAATQTETTQLPEETRERTREQFEKLLESNRKLFESNESLRKEMEQRSAAKETFAAVQDVPQPIQESVNPEDFVEADEKGNKYINEARLKAKINEINQRASKAEKAIENYIKTSEDKEIDRQNREAFTAHPDLNPKDKSFDPELNRQVRGILFDSMYNPEEYGGRPLSFKDAGDIIKARYVKEQKAEPGKKEDKDKDEKAKAGKDAKEQGSADATSQPEVTRTPPLAEQEEMTRLRNATRTGSNEALAQRLLNTDHVQHDQVEE